MKKLILLHDFYNCCIISLFQTYEVSVLETKPAAAVSVIECDLNVDFAPYVGYQEPDYKPKNSAAG